jgi:predicted Zn-dependent protease
VTATTRATDQARLTGLAALARAARVHGVVIVTDPALGVGALSYRSPCHQAPVVALGTDLLHPEAAVRLQGALAHEIAHHHAHLHAPADRLWGHLPTATTIATCGAVVAMALGLLAAAAVLLAVAAACHLRQARRRRLEEYDADLTAVQLLDAAGLDGRQITLATLGEIAEQETSRWYRYIGWITSTHPTPAARIRQIHRGRPARRMRRPAVGICWRTPRPGRNTTD